MSSTNKTTNYELSQFIGADKPAWLGDYNTDMSKIDAGIHSAQTTATGADGKADTNKTAIGTLANLTTDEKTSLVGAINEVDSHADTAQGTANGAATNANSALNKATGLENSFTFGTPTNLTWTASLGTVNSNNVKVVKSQNGATAKIYGFVDLTNVASNTTITLTSSDTGLRPDSAINIMNSGLVQNLYRYNFGGNQFTVPYTNSLEFTLNTNGTISISLPSNSAYTNIQLTFVACVLFITDFGD